MKIFDGHIDTLNKIYSSKEDISFLKRNHTTHVDLPRARSGGLIGGFFAINVPPHPSSPEADFMYHLTITKNGYDKKLDSAIDTTYAKEFTDKVINLLDTIEKESQEKVSVVRNFREINKNLKNNVFSIVLHFEDAVAIDEDLANLEYYFDKGLRSVGITWSRPNVFGVGVPFRYPHTPDTGKGLTKAGKQLIKKCNKLGIMIDLTHLNEKGFWDTEKITSKPLVATHSNAYAICPCTRSLTDKQIDAIGASKGVIGINFEPGLLRPDGKPEKKTSPDLIIQHINYMVDRIGIDHVAFGSDFDGAMLPQGIKDVADFPKLIEKLKKAGYDKKSIEKISLGNWMRVLKETLV